MPISMQTLLALQPHTAKLRVSDPVLRVWGLPPLRWVFYTRECSLFYGCGCNHTTNDSVCIKWKEANATLAKQAPEPVRKIDATATPPI